jgi:hypothetical protein
MQATFNAKERTLCEIVALGLSAGWKFIKATRTQGSLFGHILAVLVHIPVQEEDDGQSHNNFVPAGECAGSAFSSAPAATAVVAVANLDDGTGIHEESRIDTPTFAFASNVDLRSVAADSISTSISISTTTCAAAAVPVRLDHRSGRGRGIMRRASSPLLGRLRLQPSNVELNMGVESNSESSGSGEEGHSESTGGGRDDNSNGRRGPTQKKKGSLGMTFTDSYRVSKSASLTILLSLAFLSALSFHHSSSLD